MQSEARERRNFLKPGFIFDAFFSVAALLLTPVILLHTADAKSGRDSAAFGWLVVVAAAAEIVALTIVLPALFRVHRKNTLGVSLFFFWLMHFCMQIMLAVTIVLPALGFAEPSNAVAALMIFWIIKEF